MIIAPVTSGGKNERILSAPNSMTRPASTRYSAPATIMPPHAYLKPSIYSALPSAALPDASAATVHIAAMNANDEPRNAGTLPPVTKWNISVPRPAHSSAIAGSSPVSIGTSTVEPNMANTCCMPSTTFYPLTLCCALHLIYPSIYGRASAADIPLKGPHPSYMSNSATRLTPSNRHHDRDEFALAGGHVLADVVRAHRQLAVAAVNKRHKLQRVTRPMSIIASIAARAVRPVNRTSSTMIMSLPVTVNGTSVDLTCGCSLSMDRSSR